MKKILYVILVAVISMFILCQNSETNAPKILSFSKRVIQITNLDKEISTIEMRRNILNNVSIIVNLRNIPHTTNNILIENGFKKKGDTYICDEYCITIQGNMLVFSYL